MHQKSAAAIRNTIAVARPDAGGAASPWALGAGAFGGAFAGGAAESFGAGGGQVMLPSLTTVVPRITSSSMLTTMRPSFALQSSSDRKSTRLNSSHLVISYAVFCLKKKKTHNICI